jgi:hypothetical protein
MRPTAAVLSLTISALLASCAGMDADACRTSDWYALGERDGLHYGLRPQIDQYAHQCGQHGVQAAEKEYMAGWIDGYREFTRRSTGADCCAPN